MKMGTQDSHYPGRIGTRVPILPEKWGPGVPIIGGPYFHVTVVITPLTSLMKDQVKKYGDKALMGVL